MITYAQTNKRIIYLGLFILSSVYILLFSGATSPLYILYTPDSSILMSIGRQILDGKILYVDSFDSKGPVLFIYQALAQSLIPGKGGIFFLQVINLFFAVLFLYKTSDILTNSIYKNIFAIAAFLTYLSFTMGGGNQIEEYCMTYSFITLYLVFKYYYKTHTLSKTEMVIISLCFSIVFWMRPNNTGIISACILFILLIQNKKKWTFNFDFIHIFLVSFILFSCIISAYFFRSRTLDNLIYAVFNSNIKYSSYIYEQEVIPLLKYILPNLIVLITLFIGIFSSYKKEKDKNIIYMGVLLGIFAFVPINMRFGIHFYMTLLAPVFTLGLLLFLRNNNFIFYRKRELIPVSIFLSIFLAYQFFFNWNKLKDFDKDYIVSAKEVVSKIPDKDRIHSFGYQVDARLFLVTELEPTFQYYFYQEWQGYFDNQILSAVNNNMKSENTLWVITQKDLMKDSLNEYAHELLSFEYNLHFENEFFSLYKRKNFIHTELIRFIMLTRPSLFVENR
ncbi:MAG: hypothetical protein E6772_05850 [Dysgonomonas sp.]|nr:hypothetical protein [Dysgonomonas sp.]